MKRKYKNTISEINADFFYGVEVEHSPAHEMETLFVTGIQSITDILEQLNNISKKITHIYCGANQSFCPKVDHARNQNAWEDMIISLLEKNYWVTLDFDIKYAEQICNSKLCGHKKFIPMLSIKLPNINLFNYNTTIKIDDIGFDATNDGIWCWRLHDLMDPSKFTSWDAYKDDTQCELAKKGK